MRKYFRIICVIMVLCITMAGCSAKSTSTVTEKTGGNKDVDERILPYRFADREEGIEYLMSNKEYYDGFSENDLAYRMQKTDASLDEYKAFVREQVQEFTDEEKAMIDKYMSGIKKKIADNSYHLPPLDEIVFVCTTMKEELGAAAYTHGTQIYIGKETMESFAGDGKYYEEMEYILAHEVFHCLTRSNPDFRADMYKIIHFTVQEKEYVIPPSVMDYYISNPDVSHHNAYAEFIINGKPVNCFMATVTTKHFEKKGDLVFDTATSALVPIDGSDVYYYPDDATNFNDVLGKNTDYTLDPEECMADNFGLTIVFGKDGPEKKGYETPEIIEAIRTYLQK